MSKDRHCIVPRCREKVAIDYLNNYLCQTHWDALCDDDMDVAKHIKIASGTPKEAMPEGGQKNESNSI